MGHRDAVWTSTEMRSASTSFPARSRFPPASRARCGAGTAWHGTARLSLGGSPIPAGRTEQPRGSSQGQHLCGVTPLQGCATLGSSRAANEGLAGCSAPSPLCPWNKAALGPSMEMSSSLWPLGLRPYLGVGHSSTISGVCEASAARAVLVAAAGTRQHHGCWPTTGTWGPSTVLVWPSMVTGAPCHGDRGPAMRTGPWFGVLYLSPCQWLVLVYPHGSEVQGCCCGCWWDDIPCCRAAAQGNFAAAWSATCRGSTDHSGAAAGLGEAATWILPQHLMSPFAPWQLQPQ